MLSLSSFHPQSPAIALLASEPARALLDLVASPRPHAPLAEGDGHRVIVYPGLGASASVDFFTQLRWVTLQNGPRHYPI